MEELLHYHFDVDGENFASAGEASVQVKRHHGPGIKDIALAMQEGYSTAPDNIRSLGFGAGMGLPNMKRYSDEMTVESTVGVGTTITLIFQSA